jgi:hypothetical protein
MLLPWYRIFLEQLLGVLFITLSDVRRVISQEPATGLYPHPHISNSQSSQPTSLRLMLTVRSAGSHSSVDKNFSLLGYNAMPTGKCLPIFTNPHGITRLES